MWLAWRTHEPSSPRGVSLLLVAPAFALNGDPGMHDPSTVVLHDGRFYSYGTGNGLPISVSDDGWTWRRAGTLMQAVPGGRPGPEVVARGGNIVRAAVINGGGATDFCARFLDGEYRPVKDITVTLADR